MIVACTGHVEEEYILRAWACEIDEVIIKPVNTDDLRAIINDLQWYIHNYSIIMNKYQILNNFQ